ncbi:MAG TPA: ABC transporter permease subunit [Candidatus Limnocylindrales bacterium]
MNRTAIVTLVRRDLTVVVRSRAVSLPILILPVIFFVLMPAGLILLSRAISEDLGEFRELIALMPELLRRELAGLSPSATVAVWGLEYVFATFFLIVPLMTSAVIAADSFAGEKERRTLEALVHTPASDRDLFLGKLLAPWLAAMAVAVGGYAVFVVIVNVLGAGLVDRPIAITVRWALVIAWLTPAVATLAVGALVLVSARVRGFQEAYQVGALVVLPLVLLLVGQITGVLYLDIPFIVALGAVLWAIALATVRLGYRSFRRESLLVNL